VHSYVVGSNPRAIIVMPDGRKYITHAKDAENDKVSVLDANWNLLDLIDVGESPLIVPDPVGRRLFYLADRTHRPGTDRENKPRRNGTVGVLNPDNKTVTNTVEFTGAVTALAIGSDGRHLFVVQGKVLTFNSAVSAIAVAPGDARLYVTEGEHVHILDIDPATHKVLRAEELSIGDYGNSSVVVTQDRVFVGMTREGVAVLNNAGDIQHTIALPSDSWFVKSLALQGQRLYVGIDIHVSSPPQSAVAIYDIGAGYRQADLLMLGKAPLASLTATPTEVLAVNHDVSSISYIL
jgi:DNA-binding beta-propeller fold protein YncE